LTAITEDVRECDSGADIGTMGMEVAAGAVEGGAVGDGEVVKGNIIGLEFSGDECCPSSNRNALRNASFSRCTSLSSSSVSARLIRSVATILLASSNKACDNASSSASNAAFSSSTFFFAARSFCNCSFNSSTSFVCAGNDGNEGEFK